MEAIVIAVLALIALGMLSIRFGYDSRSGPRSKEEELAAYGMSWGALRLRHRPADAPDAAPVSPLGECLAEAA